MNALGNTPSQLTMLRVEARKSFSLGLLLCDPYGRPVDLTDCELTFVAKDPADETQDDSTNLIGPDASAVVENPIDGYARFEVQAATLDHEPGEYPYAIVLRAPSGYSSILVKGLLEVVSNVEFASMAATFDDLPTRQQLTILLNEANTVTVHIGGQLPPGMNYVRDDVMEALEGFDPDSIATVPIGGVPGYVLTKTAAGDYSMGWLPVGNGAFALDATGAPAGSTPTSDGTGTWTWEQSGLDATDEPANCVPVANGQGGFHWEHIDNLVPQVNWSAPPWTPGAVNNKPVLGSASAVDEDEFIHSNTLVSDMPGIHIVSTVPSTGVDGHLYFVYTP